MRANAANFCEDIQKVNPAVGKGYTEANPAAREGYTGSQPCRRGRIYRKSPCRRGRIYGMSPCRSGSIYRKSTLPQGKDCTESRQRVEELLCNSNVYSNHSLKKIESTPNPPHYKYILKVCLHFLRCTLNQNITTSQYNHMTT